MMVPFRDVSGAVDRRFNIVVDPDRALFALKDREVVWDGRWLLQRMQVYSSARCVSRPANARHQANDSSHRTDRHAATADSPGRFRKRMLGVRLLRRREPLWSLDVRSTGESVGGLPDRATACLTGIDGVSMCSRLRGLHSPAAWCPELPTAGRTSEPPGERGRVKEPERRWPG
jgi:hypothetical protein